MSSEPIAGHGDDAREPPILRFQPAGDSEPAARLRDCYKQFLLPDHRHLSGATRSVYKTALRLWRRYTDDPAVWEIDEQTWQLFRDRAKPSRSWATVGKYRRCFRTILNAARDSGLISRVPKMKGVVAVRGSRRFLTPSVMSRIFDGCRVAVWPHSRNLPAPLWWRAALLLCWNLGLRSDSELFSLAWEHVQFEADCPIAEFRGVECPHGWLRFIPPKTARHKDRLVLPLNRQVRAMLELIRPARNPHEGVWRAHPVLPMPASPQVFKWQREEIQKAAGIEPPFFQFQEIRLTCGAIYDNVPLRAGEHGLGFHVLGHAPRGVHDTFYRGVILQLVAGCEQIEQPDAFKRFLEAEGVL